MSHEKRKSVVGFPLGGRETLLDSIAKRMIQLLMDNYYKAGDQLPSEHELARQFNVGRGSIREAIKALAIVGFLRVERGKGTFVADKSDFLIGPISLGFDSATQLSSLIDARKLIEVELASLAAKHADKAAIQKLEEHLASMLHSAQTGNHDEYLQHDLAFHFVIADASGNRLLAQFMTLIRNLMRQWVSLSLEVPGVADEAFVQHREIFEAIRDGNDRFAGLAMSRHLEAMGKRLEMAKKRPVGKSETRENLQKVNPGGSVVSSINRRTLSKRKLGA